MAGERKNKAARLRKIQDRILLRLSDANLDSEVEVTFENTTEPRVRIRCSAQLGSCVRGLLRRSQISFLALNYEVPGGPTILEVVDLSESDHGHEGRGCAAPSCIRELASEYGISGKECARKLRGVGFREGLSHMSRLDTFEIDQARKLLEASGLSKTPPDGQQPGSGRRVVVRRKAKSCSVQTSKSLDTETGRSKRRKKKRRKGRSNRRAGSWTSSTKPSESNDPPFSRFQKGARAFGAGLRRVVRRQPDSGEGFGLNADDQEVKGTNFYDR